MTWFDIVQLAAVGYIATSVVGYSVYWVVSHFRIVRK